MKRILAIDDEIGALESIKAVFWDGYSVLTAQNLSDGAQHLRDHKVDLLLLDIMMPDSDDDGMRFLKEVRNLYPDLPVIMLTAVTSNQTVAEAMRLGAVDFITKPFDVKDLRNVADAAISNSNLRRQQEAFRRELAETSRSNTLIGESPIIRKIIDQAKQLASSNDAYYFAGERGTGKKTLAQHIHSISARCEQPFITLNCSSLPQELAEAEIFGEDDGKVGGGTPGSHSFDKLGRLDLASSGTLVLQGAEYLTLHAQDRLARVVRDGVFTRQNNSKDVRTSARILFCGLQGIDSEHMNELMSVALRAEIGKNTLELPPLRDRAEDIPLLSYSFLNRYRKNMGAELSDFETEAMELLRKYKWPGNVRELDNAIESVVTLYGQEKSVRPENLPIEIQGARAFAANFVGTGASLEEQTDEFQRRLIIEALEKANGIKNRAATILKTTPRILSYRMMQLDIRPSTHVE